MLDKLVEENKKLKIYHYYVDILKQIKYNYDTLEYQLQFMYIILSKNNFNSNNKYVPLSLLSYYVYHLKNAKMPLPNPGLLYNHHELMNHNEKEKLYLQDHSFYCLNPTDSTFSSNEKSISPLSPIESENPQEKNSIELSVKEESLPLLLPTENESEIKEEPKNTLFEELESSSKQDGVYPFLSGDNEEEEKEERLDTKTIRSTPLTTHIQQEQPVSIKNPFYQQLNAINRDYYTKNSVVNPAMNEKNNKLIIKFQASKEFIKEHSEKVVTHIDYSIHDTVRKNNYTYTKQIMDRYQHAVDLQQRVFQLYHRIDYNHVCMIII